ncbi:MAG: tRNA lysidine(34) synthetase TilS [Proteobacteria bacterium]|nr:tRNA lysidine(34) synthetase TilS [Pseudomonadota bacterium]
MSLLHILLRAQEVHGAELSVVSVDHGLREGSAADAAFVTRLCAELSVSCAVVQIKSGASEAEARAGRYAVFAELEADHIALAHHADDQIETIVLNLLRGTGPRGLAGMRGVRGRYVRPLLRERGATLRGWLREKGLSARQDPTNDQPRFLRNRIRHELLPLVEDLRPGAPVGWLETARLLREQDGLVSRLAERLGPPPWELGALREPAVVRRAVLNHCPGALNRHADAVLEVIRAAAGTVNLPKGRIARVRKGWLHVD